MRKVKVDKEAEPEIEGRMKFGVCFFFYVK